MRWCLLLALVLGCSHDEPQLPPDPAPAPPPAPAVKQKLPTDFGTCELDGEQITAQSRQVTTKYWAKDDPSAPPLSVNCIGKTGRVSFSAAPGASVPFGPHTYALVAKGGELVVMARAKDKQLSATTGTIDVTAFDDKHIAGTIDVTGTATGGTKVTLTGHFDFRR